jgi:tetrahydromethanopterin S-methyltransferase subunit B
VDNREEVRGVYIPTAEQAGIIAENNNSILIVELENVSEKIMSEAKKGATHANIFCKSVDHIKMVLENYGYRVDIISETAIEVFW